jgi:hypothetical protein
VPRDLHPGADSVGKAHQVASWPQAVIWVSVFACAHGVYKRDKRRGVATRPTCSAKSNENELKESGLLSYARANVHNLRQPITRCPGASHRYSHSYRGSYRNSLCQPRACIVWSSSRHLTLSIVELFSDAELSSGPELSSDAGLGYHLTLSCHLTLHMLPGADRHRTPLNQGHSETRSKRTRRTGPHLHWRYPKRATSPQFAGRRAHRHRTPTQAL